MRFLALLILISCSHSRQKYVVNEFEDEDLETLISYEAKKVPHRTKGSKK